MSPPPPPPVYGLCWWRRRMKSLPQLLHGEVKYPPLLGRHIDVLVAWGRKRGVARALRWPWEEAVPMLYAEDGFLRSLHLGHRDPPLSIVLDDLGIYYDASAPSRFETLMQAPADTSQLERGRRLGALWRAERVSKYNHAEEAPLPVSEPYVLAVDQTAGDASIRGGLADSSSFARMLEAALDEHPNLPVVLKVHPDVIAGRKEGHFGTLPPSASRRVTVVASDLHPPALLASAAAVYTVSSQMGFEALMWGKPVRTFGMPFYAGWGLTVDELPAPPRRRSPIAPTLEGLVHAALVQYPRYVDPETSTPCEPERVMRWLGEQRRRRGLHRLSTSG